MILTSPLSRWLFLWFWKEDGTSTLGEQPAIFNFLFNSKNHASIPLGQFISILRAIFRCLKSTFFNRNFTSSRPKVLKVCTNLWPFANLIRMHKRNIARSSDP
jgi:hypothetical protein